VNLLPYFEAMNDLALSAAIRESLWMVAVINTLHLLFLVMFAGAVLIVDLRLLGRGASEQPLSHVARDAQPWLVTALIGLTLTGVPQFLSNALREYHSYLFWMKMAVLLVALVYTFTFRRRITLADETRVAPATRKAVGLVSIALWTAVVVQARLIGLFT
jgi:putative copper export protein